MIIWAPSWNWIVAANVLLGINQGLAWSMMVIMKIDLVGPKSRGLAVGFDEFAPVSGGWRHCVRDRLRCCVDACPTTRSFLSWYRLCRARPGAIYQCWLFGIRASMSVLRQTSSRKWRLSDSEKYSRGPPFGTQLSSPVVSKLWAVEANAKNVILSTTTSMQDTGLLDVAGALFRETN